MGCWEMGGGLKAIEESAVWEKDGSGFNSTWVSLKTRSGKSVRSEIATITAVAIIAPVMIEIRLTDMMRYQLYNSVSS